MYCLALCNTFIITLLFCCAWISSSQDNIAFSSFFLLLFLKRYVWEVGVEYSSLFLIFRFQKPRQANNGNPSILPIPLMRPGGTAADGKRKELWGSLWSILLLVKQSGLVADSNNYTGCVDFPPTWTLWPGLVLGWEPAKEVPGCYMEASNSKPLLLATPLENPMGSPYIGHKWMAPCTHTCLDLWPGFTEQPHCN